MNDKKKSTDFYNLSSENYLP